MKIPLHHLTQADVVTALAELGSRWADPGNQFRRHAAEITQPYPFSMIEITLVALIESLTPASLWDLIATEGVEESLGVSRIAHFIAGNTPLLVWTSLLRALLMRSESYVKLPSNETAVWAYLFKDSLEAVSPVLASSINLFEWAGGTLRKDKDLCQNVDLVMAYGSDQTISHLHTLCLPSTRFIGYGHRVSVGIVALGADYVSAALGFATDILLYDQAGCLSPQTLFVEGDWEAACEFSACLAPALSLVADQYPLPYRSPRAAGMIYETRSLAEMDPTVRKWQDETMRWTIIAKHDPAFQHSPTHSVIFVAPLASADHLRRALVPVEGKLQGCAVAGSMELPRDTFSYICAPGRLQAPPLSWPQDMIPPLKSLLL